MSSASVCGHASWLCGWCAVRRAGKDLAVLHVHDNDRWHDSHQIPFSMDIDFEAVVKALKEVHYEGYFTLEANRHLNAYSEEDIFDGMVKMQQSIRKLADMFDNL